MVEKSNIEEAKERWKLASAFWRKPFEEASIDIRMVAGDQWAADVKAARDAANRPALTFNRLHTMIQQITNQVRQARPQVKIGPGDEVATADAAAMLEGHVRHLQYASQADVAYDCAVEGAATGGFGVFRITTEYVDDDSFDQEPRIRRILDPLTVFFDPEAMEPDFSDAKFCFVRKKMRRDEFKEKYGSDPVGLDSPEFDNDWGDKENVYVAEYWHVKKETHRLVQLVDGRTGEIEDFPEVREQDIINERPTEEQMVCFSVIDGAREFEYTEWLGKWIPIVPVLGKEVMVDGDRMFISLVRFARDPQKLLNSYKSGIAESIGRASKSQFMGYEGQFTNDTWKNINQTPILQVNPKMVNGETAPLPQVLNNEPPIQALSNAAMQEADDIKASGGYIDNVVSPSQQSQLSGIAVKRREAQAGLVNYHISDNLTRAQWHAGRILVDLIPKLYDTPRAVRTRKPDGTTALAGITQNGQPVPGVDPNTETHDISVGRYDVTITSGPSYDTKIQEEADVLSEVIGGNPQMMSVFGDLWFKLKGYEELAERAKLALAPPIQQALQAQSQSALPPEVQMQLTQAQQQIQMLQSQLQAELLEKKSRILEAQTKVLVAEINAQKDLGVQSMKEDHANKRAIFQGDLQAIDKKLEMMHESELAPPPLAQQPSKGNA